MNETIQMILQGLGVVLAAALVFLAKQYVIPFIQSKLSANQYDLIRNFVIDMMAAAEEKFYEAGQGTTKKEFVMYQVQVFCEKIGVPYNESYISSLIDGMTKVLTVDGVINTD